jgi:hypothetical protein
MISSLTTATIRSTTRIDVGPFCAAGGAAGAGVAGAGSCTAGAGDAGATGAGATGGVAGAVAGAGGCGGGTSVVCAQTPAVVRAPTSPNTQTERAKRISLVMPYS